MPEQTVILVVEDEALVRMDLAQRLTDARFEIVEAGSAAEAITTLENDDRIRVVFTDIQMPGTMDGIALARYIRNRWPPTIIVVSSGKVTPKSDQLPDDMMFLPKPYDRVTLAQVLNDVAVRLSV